MYQIVIKIKQDEHMYPALLGDHAYSFLSSKSGSKGSLFPLSALGLIHLFSQKRWMISQICVTGAKVCNWQHENVSGVFRHILQGAHYI